MTHNKGGGPRHSGEGLTTAYLRESNGEDYKELNVNKKKPRRKRWTVGKKFPQAREDAH